jgi:hypothetical protein
MSKKFWHHTMRRMRPLSPWLFFGLATVFLVLHLFALRSNNLHAVRLREKVIEVDKANGDVEAALKQLREFTYAHMNAGLANDPSAIKPPVQLKYTYERLVAAEKERVSKANTAIYNNAQKECERLFPVGLSGSGRIPCITDYVTKNGVVEQPIPDALYKFDFVSPSWSPDWAGWTVVLSVLFFILFAVRLGLQLWLRSYLKQHA